MAINKHGLVMRGLKRTSGMTKDYGDYDGRYIELFYDRKSGEVWGVFHYSIGMNEWTECHSSEVIRICFTAWHMTMQEISDMIMKRINDALGI